MRLQTARWPPQGRKWAGKTQKLRQIHRFRVTLFHVAASRSLSAGAKLVLNTIPIALLLGSSAAFGSATNKSEEGALSSSRIQKVPTITDAWARATVPGQSVGAAYMKIFSPTNAVLVKAETMMAKAVEVHVMDHQKGVMRMRANGPVEIAGGTTVELVPGGKHLMLLGLSKPLKAGETFPMKLIFAGTGGESTVIVQIPIRVNGQ